MAGVFGSNLLQSLKVLTPAEIKRLTETKHQREGNKTGGLHSEDGSVIDLESEKGKVLSDGKKKRQQQQAKKGKDQEQTQQKEVDPYKDKLVQATQDSVQISESAKQMKQNSQENLTLRSDQSSKMIRTEQEAKLESVGIFSATKIKEEQARLQALEESKKDSASVFLLKEKEKTKESQEKLKRSTVFESYDSSAKLKRGTGKKKQDQKKDVNLGEEETLGILFNKKHY